MRLLISLSAGLVALLSVSPAAAQSVTPGYPPLGVGQCPTGPEVISFRQQSSEIRRRQIEAFNDILRKDACRGNAQINIESFATAGESDSLAVRRAVAVRAQLVELGLPEDRIHMAAYGSTASRNPHASTDARVTVSWSSPGTN